MNQKYVKDFALFYIIFTCCMSHITREVLEQSLNFGNASKNLVLKCSPGRAKVVIMKIVMEPLRNS